VKESHQRQRAKQGLTLVEMRYTVIDTHLARTIRSSHRTVIMLLPPSVLRAGRIIQTMLLVSAAVP
jgi:hypothetical protein